MREGLDDSCDPKDISQIQGPETGHWRLKNYPFPEWFKRRYWMGNKSRDDPASPDYTLGPAKR